MTGLGFRIKSGYAIAVVLTGSRQAPVALARRVVELSDPEVAETRQPYLFIDNLTLRSLQFRGAQPMRGVEPEINVQMDVTGYALLGTS